MTMTMVMVELQGPERLLTMIRSKISPLLLSEHQEAE